MRIEMGRVAFRLGCSMSSSITLWAVKAARPAPPFVDALDGATTKLRGLATGRPGARADETVANWSSGEKDYSSHRDTILRLVEAILLRKRCGVGYHSPASRSAKSYSFDPYKLVTVSGGLYCLGKVPRYGDIVTLAVDRIRSLQLADGTFEVDPEFDPETRRAGAFGVVQEEPMDVVVRFSDEQAPYIRERQWHPSQKIRELPDGRIELCFHAGGTFEIARWILGWGDAAEVLAPRELRNHVSNVLRAACANYSG